MHDIEETNIELENPQRHQEYELTRDMGDCYASLGEYEQAQHYYDRAASLGPDEADPYVGLGVIALQQEQYDQAMTAFNVARRLNRHSAKAYCGLGMIAQKQQRHSDAFEMYLQCLDLDQNNLTALLGLFQTSCQMGSFSKVIYYLEAFLDLHPDDISVMFCLATLYFRDGCFLEAKSLLKDIVNMDSDHQDALNLLEEAEHRLAQHSTSKPI